MERQRTFLVSDISQFLQITIILMPKWYTWGWHILIPYTQGDREEGFWKYIPENGVKGVEVWEPGFGISGKPGRDNVSSREWLIVSNDTWGQSKKWEQTIGFVHYNVIGTFNWWISVAIEWEGWTAVGYGASGGEKENNIYTALERFNKEKRK